MLGAYWTSNSYDRAEVIAEFGTTQQEDISIVNIADHGEAGQEARPLSTTRENDVVKKATSSFVKQNPEKISGSIRVRHTNKDMGENTYVCTIEVTALHDLSDVKIVCVSLKDIQFDGQSTFRYESIKVGTVKKNEIQVLLTNGLYGEFVVYAQGITRVGRKTHTNYQISIGIKPNRNVQLEGKIDRERNEVLMPAE